MLRGGLALQRGRRGLLRDGEQVGLGRRVRKGARREGAAFRAPPGSDKARAQRRALAHSHGIDPGGPRDEAANGCPDPGRLALVCVTRLTTHPAEVALRGRGDASYCSGRDAMFSGGRGSQPSLE